MKQNKHKMSLGISTEAKINKEFIQAWKKAERGQPIKIKERIYFLDANTLLQILSDRRLSLLITLKNIGSSSIRALSRKLHRNYKNVYDDIKLLSKAGLLHETSDKALYVPWDKIQTEIDLAA